MAAVVVMGALPIQALGTVVYQCMTLLYPACRKKELAESMNRGPCLLAVQAT
jgi:hypothetical protein